MGYDSVQYNYKNADFDQFNGELTISLIDWVNLLSDCDINVNVVLFYDKLSETMYLLYQVVCQRFEFSVVRIHDGTHLNLEINLGKEKISQEMESILCSMRTLN